MEGEVSREYNWFKSQHRSFPADRSKAVRL